MLLRRNRGPGPDFSVPDVRWRWEPASGCAVQSGIGGPNSNYERWMRPSAFSGVACEAKAAFRAAVQSDIDSDAANQLPPAKGLERWNERHPEHAREPLAPPSETLMALAYELGSRRARRRPKRGLSSMTMAGSPWTTAGSWRCSRRRWSVGQGGAAAWSSLSEPRAWA